MRYNFNLRFLRSLIGLILLASSFQESHQTNYSPLSSNYENLNYTNGKESFKKKLVSILHKESRNENDKNPFDAFFGALSSTDNDGVFKDTNISQGSRVSISNIDAHNEKKVADNNYGTVNKNGDNSTSNSQDNSKVFDWGLHTKVSNHLSDYKINPINSQGRVMQSFVELFSVIIKGHESSKKSYRKSFKEVVVPNLITAVSNNELDGAARGILMNEVLIETELGKASIPKTRPDGLPSISFIGIENEVMPLHVIYIKQSDRFSFKTFPNFVPPDIPKIAGKRLKEWVTLKYKQIHDSLVVKSKEDLDSNALLESLNSYGIYFAIEFKDDAVCFLSEITRYISNNTQGTDDNKSLVSRVSRILFSRLRPFISLQSTFVPLEMSEFRSLSFIGSPILMNRADNEDDLLTQQALFYWSIESENFLNDYKRRDHICSEREILANTEYKQHCMIYPNGKNPRNPNSFNNGFITTVSCFGLQPEGTMALFLYKSLLSLRICQKDGSWSDIKVLSNQNRATIIFHKCHSRNSNKESFYSRVSTASIFED
ncbi:putative signal peptide-containing protein [Cryptosporidium canis]|uniref:Signal peptide-containing protein n=1 Tax=Cryptosporidium canis TaxID=195482 RepID=A0A9D5DHZ0_9CRYT|nr:putative signal peptide-containing protein [Cryptosporidium canis]